LVFAADGTTTKERKRYKTFYTREAATKFAKANGIGLDDVTRYIGELEFSDAELADEN